MNSKTRTGLVQTTLDELAFQQLKKNVRNEGISISAYLRRLVLKDQGRIDPSAIIIRISELENRTNKIEKALLCSNTHGGIKEK